MISVPRLITIASCDLLVGISTCDYIDRVLRSTGYDLLLGVVQIRRWIGHRMASP